MIVAIVLCFFLHFARSNPSITVYGDVFKDKDFFQNTFPWVIDHIGGEISVEFHLLGSGRHTIPQMCALKELRMNAFLQAQYLKCESEGNPSSYCLCETGIEPERFRDCVNQGGDMAAYAASRYKMLGIDTTPIIEMGPRSTVFGVPAHWYLKKICTTFGDDLPLGCTTSCNYCNNGTVQFVEKKALAQFDKECGACYPGNTHTTTTTTTPYITSV